MSELSGGAALLAAYLLFEKLGFGMEFFFITVAVSTLAMLSVLSATRTNVPFALGLLSLLLAASMAPFWSSSGALRPFPFSTGLVASELDSLTAAILAVSIFAGYNLINSRKLELRKLLLVIPAGMFAGLIGLATILLLAIIVDRGWWSLRLSGRLGAAPDAVRIDHMSTVLLVGAVATLLIEPWVDQLSVLCAQSVHHATC